MSKFYMSKEELRRWLPEGKFYDEHLDRFAFSFRNLPDLPKKFSCISIGSWGAEAPLLIEVFGASRVVCIRAPEKGVPQHEVRGVKVSASSRKVSVDLFALNAEKEPIPEVLRDFDLCISWEVLEHLNQDPPFFLWQTIHTVKVGGYITLTTPNALWYYYTIAYLYGNNALGLKLQHNLPYATHWRLYSPVEVAEMVRNMGCKITYLTTFLKTESYSLKSKLFVWMLEYLRKNSDNGTCTIGQHILLLARKEHESDVYRPHWLFPLSDSGGRDSHLKME